MHLSTVHMPIGFSDTMKWAETFASWFLHISLDSYKVRQFYQRCTIFFFQSAFICISLVFNCSFWPHMSRKGILKLMKQPPADYLARPKHGRAHHLCCLESCPASPPVVYHWRDKRRKINGWEHRLCARKVMAIPATMVNNLRQFIGPWPAPNSLARNNGSTRYSKKDWNTDV